MKTPKITRAKRASKQLIIEINTVIIKLKQNENNHRCRNRFSRQEP